MCKIKTKRELRRMRGGINKEFKQVSQHLSPDEGPGCSFEEWPPGCLYLQATLAECDLWTVNWLRILQLCRPQAQSCTQRMAANLAHKHKRRHYLEKPHDLGDPGKVKSHSMSLNSH